MIKKEKVLPIRMKKLQALLRRLPPNHLSRQRIDEELAKSMAGYRGEVSIDYQLATLPKKESIILHDLRLTQNGTHFFQIDILLMTSRFLLIIEVKNMSGTLIFDQSFHQLLRTYNGKEEAFPDPLIQVRRQQLFLQRWLEENQFLKIPVHSLIVISNPATILKSIPSFSETVSKKVIHAAVLPSKIDGLIRSHPNEILTKRDLNKLSRYLIKHHTSLDPNVLSQFQIPKTDVRSGVHCPSCFALPMQRRNGTWICTFCHLSSKNAHLSSLEDYKLLISPTITNKQLREFLHIASTSTATKLLVKLKLEYTGGNKNRKYYLFLE